jgi:hypothetical protein
MKSRDGEIRKIEGLIQTGGRPSTGDARQEQRVQQTTFWILAYPRRPHMFALGPPKPSSAIGTIPSWGNRSFVIGIAPRARHNFLAVEQIDVFA